LKWRYLVSESEEWAAYRLVNADFRDDDMNLASIRLVDRYAYCQSKLSKAVEMFPQGVHYSLKPRITCVHVPY
jgi:hypothetical protein